MLPRKKLLPLRSEFDRIRASAKRYDSPSFGLLVSYQRERVQALAAGQEAQVAFIVSKKIDKRSVVRHQIKRKLSEAVSFFLPRLGKNLELVFLAKKEAIGMETEKLREEIHNSLTRAKLL